MKARLLVFVFVFGIAALALGWIYESNLRPPKQETKSLIPDDIDYFLTNMNYRALDVNGELDFQLYSPRLEHYPRNDVSKLETPSMQVNRGSDPWQIDALTGSFQHAKNIMRLRKEVIMQKQGVRPMQVYTESIRFEVNRDLVTADRDILMIDQQGRIEAKHAVFDLAEKIYTFKKTRAVYHREAG